MYSQFMMHGQKNIKLRTRYLRQTHSPVQWLPLPGAEVKKELSCTSNLPFLSTEQLPGRIKNYFECKGLEFRNL